MPEVESHSRPSHERRKPPGHAASIDEAWVAYKQTKSKAIRDRLIEHYSHLVALIARRFHARLPHTVDIEDLVQVGHFGLIDAIESFDPDRGARFETFCGLRVHGAMVDELRTLDWASRVTRTRLTRLSEAHNRLWTMLGRNPTETEIAEYLKIGPEEMQRHLDVGPPVAVISLSQNWYETDSEKDVCKLDVLRDDAQVDPLTESQKSDLRDHITRGLTRAERLIVLLYYYEQMTMKEIGATLDLSESRVSQMHSSIVARLKAHLGHREREFQD